MYSPPFLAFVEHFNRGEYRACVEPLEEIWFAERDDFHKALIRLSVGLNQIGLGLHSGPAFLLSTALELLAPYGARHRGVDLAALRHFIAAQHAALDELSGSKVVPAFRIRLDPPPLIAAEER